MVKSKWSGNGLNNVKADSCRCVHQAATRVSGHQLNHCLLRNYYKYFSRVIRFLVFACCRLPAAVMRLSPPMWGVRGAKWARTASNTNKWSKMITEANHEVTRNTVNQLRVVGLIHSTWPSLFYNLICALTWWHVPSDIPRLSSVNSHQRNWISETFATHFETRNEFV